jgi:type II secretory ATPase GspE/PulE/Tfp pilus assembly ATPase PilB-like protein
VPAVTIPRPTPTAVPPRPPPPTVARTQAVAPPPLPPSSSAVKPPLPTRAPPREPVREPVRESALPTAATPPNHPRVSVHLSNGRRLDAELVSLDLRDDHCDLASRDASGRAIAGSVPYDKITWIAFGERADEGLATARIVQVHLVGGTTLTLRVEGDPVAERPGFWAANTEAAGARVFVFAHAVERISAVDARPSQMPSEADAVEIGRSDPDLSLRSRKRMRLGEVLVEAGLATEADIERALAEQKRRPGRRLGAVLLDLGLVNELELARTLSEKFRLPFVDLVERPVDRALVAQIGHEFLRKHQIVPLGADVTSIAVAIGDPLAVESIDALRYLVRKRVVEHIATPTSIDKALRAFSDEAQKRRAAQELDSMLIEISAEVEREPEETAPAMGGDSDNAVIRLVNQIVIDAHRRGASDVHIEPNGPERPVVVRLRRDGDCELYQELPPAFRHAVVARVKILARLDISERRKPQDGKIRFRLRDRTLDLRVATLPTTGDNEDVVMRLLGDSKPPKLDGLRFAERNLAAVRDLIDRPYGLLLCVGPTGSGKTTTVHSMLSMLNSVDRKIWTAEDPVEITQPGLRQVQVQPKVGFTFANALRAFLRADPDVVMIGEMRDQETASIAVEAALTGHLVLSTLHTNSAPETITRLLDMGLEPFSFADALLGVVAQRLAKALCTKCAAPRRPSPSELAAFAEAFEPGEFAARYPDAARTEVLEPIGCEACGDTGYKGRVGIHEVLVADEGIRAAISRRAPVGEVRARARAGGMTTLQQDGIDKILRGITDWKSVLAVCSR